MRFLFGLIFGAAMTLLVATAMNAPTGKIVGQLVDSWQTAAAWLEAAAARGDAAQTAQQSFPEQAGPVQAGPTRADPPAVDQLTTLAPSVPAPETVAAETNAPETVAPDTVDDNQPIVDNQTYASAEPLPELPGTEPDLPPVPETSTVGEAVVWAPFHSEASAQGFATRLTHQLSRPFYVKKQRAATYLVVFEYADAAERTALEQQIAYVTGQAAP